MEIIPSLFPRFPNFFGVLTFEKLGKSSLSDKGIGSNKIRSGRKTEKIRTILRVSFFDRHGFIN